MSKIRDVLVLNHSDGVSGSVHFSDCSVILWREGTDLVGRSADGEVTRMDIDTLIDCGYGYAIEYFENGPSADTKMRMMTEGEEIEYWREFEEAGPQTIFNTRLKPREPK
jgi:hypothetical protein